MDGTEVVDTFTGLNNVNYTWSTLDRDEGSYESGLRFDVDGVEQLDSDIRTVIVDRSPPTIVSSTPEQDAEHVPAAPPITVTFSEPLLADSVTTETVKLSLGGQEIDYTVTLSGDGLTVTLRTLHDARRDLHHYEYEIYYEARRRWGLDCPERRVI